MNLPQWIAESSSPSSNPTPYLWRSLQSFWHKVDLRYEDDKPWWAAWEPQKCLIFHRGKVLFGRPEVERKSRNKNETRSQKDAFWEFHIKSQNLRNILPRFVLEEEEVNAGNLCPEDEGHPGPGGVHVESMDDGDDEVPHELETFSMDGRPDKHQEHQVHLAGAI